MSRKRRHNRRKKHASPAGWIAAIIIIAAAAAAFIHFKGRSLTSPSLDVTHLEESSAALHPANGSYYVICIDAGHGGSQCGAVSGDVYESTINLEIADRVESILEDAGFTVIMTRTSDTEVSLSDRADMANNANADVFVSIHENMLDGDTSTHGAETWIYAEDQYDAAALASAIQTCLVDSTGAEDRGLMADPELAVLNLTQMPACLVECGFMSNPSDLRHLTSERYQERAAYGIAQGIVDYLAGDGTIAYTVTTQS